MNRPLILSLDDQPTPVRDLMTQLTPEGFDLQFPDGDREGLRDSIRQADYVLIERGSLPAELLEAATRLRLIQKCGRGVEGIDVASVARLGIPLCCTTGANAIGTAELAVALMLAVYRRICEVHSALKEGRWLKLQVRLASYELHGKAVGMVGVGSVGQQAAQILSHGFGCRLSYFSRRRLPLEKEESLSLTYAPLDSLLEQSDILSLHVPLSTETHHLIAAPQLARMKPSAILINTSRGPIVDEKALYEALRQKAIAAAGLDVFDREPINPDNPLLTLDNVVLSPHCGGGTLESMTRVFSRAFSNICKRERGEPLPEEDLVL